MLVVFYVKLGCRKTGLSNLISFHWCSPCTHMINSVNHNFNHQNIPLLIMRQKRSLYILLFHYLFNVCTNLKYTLVGMSLQFFISLRMSHIHIIYLFIYFQTQYTFKVYVSFLVSEISLLPLSAVLYTNLKCTHANDHVITATICN